MPPPERLPDFARTVAGHHAKTTSYVLASSGRCLEIRDQEVARVRRSLVALDPSDLEALRPSGSWVLAAVLCPRDATEAVAAWTARLPTRERGRVRLYLHAATDPVEALRASYARGLDDPKTATVRDFKSFHKQLGWDFNKVYRDATPAA